MLGDTFTLAFYDGDVVLNKVNQDGYSSEYLLRTTGIEHRVKVRHSKVKATPTRQAMDRHNMEYVQTIFATESVPEFDRKVYFVMEHLPSDNGTLCAYVMDALLNWPEDTTPGAFDELIDLFQWQS